MPSQEYKILIQLKNIPIQIYVSPADTNKTKASFINLKKALRIFENDFGPYEWERVGYVGVPFLYGAMEHATNIAYPLAFVTGTLDYETLFAHELSHHWFGDLVTCSSAEDIWLNEGLACYCESVFTEGLYGKVSFKNYQRNTHKTALQSAYLLDKGYRALYGIPAEYTYGTTVYDKGADVVHTLRNYLGDSLFFKTVKAYMKQYAFQNVTTSDFENYISAKTSVNLTDFFNTWVYGKGFPHFSIDSFNIRHKTQDTSIKNFDAEVYVRQRLRGMDVFAKSNKLEITFMSNDWKSYTDTIVFSGEFGNKIFHVSFPPDFVMVDKEEKVADATTDNYKVIKAKGTYDFADTYFKLIVNNVSDSAFVRVEHNWIAPDKMKKTNKDIKRLSDSRYWKIDGIFPNGMATKASFYFTRSRS